MSSRAPDSVRGSTQCSLAISADDRNWFLVNASPDVRQQINATPRLHPRGLRDSPVAGVILTNGEIDAVAGLLSLREGAPLSIYAHQAVLDILASNSLFDVLRPDRVTRRPLPLNEPFEAKRADEHPCGLKVEAFAVAGKTPWYLESDIQRAPQDEDCWGGEKLENETLGLTVSSDGGNARIVIVPGCAAITPELKQRLDGASLVFFDGTLWRDDEMAHAGLGARTGRQMGHVSMSGPDGVIENLADLNIGHKVFLHINNSNPAWLDSSPEHAMLARAGWQVPHDGMEFCV